MRDYLTISLVMLAYFSPVIYQAILLIKEEKVKRKKILNKLLKIIKITVPIFIIATSIILILNHTNYLNYSKPIPFKDYDKITFKDFKGLEFFHKEFEGSKQFAYIVTTIKYQIDKDSTKITALFHPSRSFVYDRNSKDKGLLTHELYHFKITEVYARRLRKAISKTKFSSKQKLEEIILNYWKKERNYQQKYDYDTYHSYIYGEQKKYEREIDSLLYLFIDFKSPKVKANVKI